jgi:hypothetical protein
VIAHRKTVWRESNITATELRYPITAFRRFSRRSPAQ